MPNPWRFELHPEVIVLVVALCATYTYLVRSVGPAAVKAGEQPITRKNINAFVASMALMFVASWWPIHDIGEQYLYSVHMLQHMMLSYFMPPLIWMATPEWLMRTIIGNGRFYQVVRWLAHPVVAGVVFNVAVMVLHIPGVVQVSTESGVTHYALHVLVVVTSLLMWLPVCGPIPEFRIGTGATMIYLFLQSVVPTIPAGWLTFADDPVYKAYGNQPLRVWGVSAVSDQQWAGAIMKTGGSIFLWVIIIRLWFKRFASSYATEHNYRRARPAAALPVDDAPLTYADVEREFANTPAAPER